MGNLVTSFGNAMNYSLGVSSALVSDCVNSGVGNSDTCSGLAQRVGYVAGGDFAARTTAGLFGVSTACIGMQQLVDACGRKTWKQTGFKLLQAGSTLALSGGLLALTFCFPVTTLDNTGNYSFTGISPLGRV
jgi:hypothetical protein